MTNSDKGRKVRCVYMYRDDLIYGPVVTCANVDAEHNTITLTDEDGKLIYAEEGYPDYKVYEIANYDITCVR